MAKKSGGEKSIGQKIAETVDHIIHPNASEPTVTPPADESNAPVDSGVEQNKKKVQAYKSDMDKHKKFDKFN